VVGRLSYANVMATIAVFLALGGGAYAALHLPKNSIRSKQIKNHQVKKADLAKNAVDSKKIQDGSVLRGDLGSGVLSGLVVASAQADSLPAATPTDPVPLSGSTSFTPVSGRPNLVMLDVRATTADVGAPLCQPVVALSINGEAVDTAFLGTPGAALHSTEDSFADPWGLGRPGVAQNMSVRVQGDADCTASSKIDSIRLVVTQLG
jgi:hypothetical protein